MGDRGEKFPDYRRIPSLEHYVLASQTKRLVELFTPSAEDGNHWDDEATEGAGAVKLGAIGCELTRDAVYPDPLAEP